MEHTAAELLRAQLYAWSDLQGNPQLPPRTPGVYGWFFRTAPTGVPCEGCLTRDSFTLLYVGISPGRDVSTQNLRSRVRYHFRGNAEGSTLRLTLGCLLEQTEAETGGLAVAIEPRFSRQVSTVRILASRRSGSS